MFLLAECDSNAVPPPEPPSLPLSLEPPEPPPPPPPPFAINLFSPSLILLISFVINSIELSVPLSPG